MRRATVSVGPPAAAGTTSVIDLAGNVACADAVPGAPAAMQASEPSKIARENKLIGSSLSESGCVFCHKCPKPNHRALHSVDCLPRLSVMAVFVILNVMSPFV